ncbi:MAG: GDSL-type esterase/lipase family protein, partial [Oscillospiraceae bacterium]
KNYDSIYIMFGANSAAATDFEELSNFIEDIKTNNESVKIYLTSLVPLKGDNETEGLTNTEIDNFNSHLLKYANENNVYYIDLNTFLVGNDGKLPKSKAESVGDRLKKDTYLEIADFLLTHVA